MKRQWKLVTALLFLFLVSACSGNENSVQSSGHKETVELTISAAASLKDVLTVIQKEYEEEHPEVELKFNYGASGSLQQQISQGAPVDLFFSAAEDKFDKLVEEGNIEEEDGIDLLGNELVLVVPKEGKLIIGNFHDLKKEEVDQISIGIPESVPAGKYAKESFEKINIWKEIEQKIVYAKDVRQVLSYVETGNVKAGVVYKTDALISDKVSIAAAADPDMHTSIIYPAGIIKNSKHYEQAKDFYDYLQSNEALKVFNEHGFITE
ncbi:molybdate ABC transporter substrate-binding protein [Metabacillus fastidiosus]|uniref:molybdate ABC transporter substrate-binding protein n=1 Tax=Metabacillus fastidiosus TaxID=1458 RepID=UPI002E1C0BC2|nr:molybdate ABC transporter substrate-binding protein [Metabacillus fastidiosus]